MRTFSCFITDDRYSVPTLCFLTADDEHQVRVLARRRLRESAHYRSIEVREDSRYLFVDDRKKGRAGRACLSEA